MGFFIAEDFPRSQQPSRPTPPAIEPSVPREVVIGEWEDTIGSWTQLTLFVKQAGLILREIHLPDGRVDRDILREVTPRGSEGRRLQNPSSQHGQAYAITRYGHLAIYDDDGYVGLAKRVITTGDQR